MGWQTGMWTGMWVGIVGGGREKGGTLDGDVRVCVRAWVGACDDGCAWTWDGDAARRGRGENGGLDCFAGWVAGSLGEGPCNNGSLQRRWSLIGW